MRQGSLMCHSCQVLAGEVALLPDLCQGESYLHLAENEASGPRALQGLPGISQLGDILGMEGWGPWGGSAVGLKCLGPRCQLCGYPFSSDEIIWMKRGHGQGVLRGTLRNLDGVCTCVLRYRGPVELGVGGKPVVKPSLLPGPSLYLICGRETRTRKAVVLLREAS